MSAIENWYSCQVHFDSIETITRAVLIKSMANEASWTWAKPTRYIRNEDRRSKIEKMFFFPQPWVFPRVFHWFNYPKCLSLSVEWKEKKNPKIKFYYSLQVIFRSSKNSFNGMYCVCAHLCFPRYPQWIWYGRAGKKKDGNESETKRKNTTATTKSDRNDETWTDL